MLAHELSSKLIEITNNPLLDARNHKLAATCGELRALIDDGADFDADIVPVVLDLCARKRGGQITTWKYFTSAIRAAAAVGRTVGLGILTARAVLAHLAARIAVGPRTAHLLAGGAAGRGATGQRIALATAIGLHPGLGTALAAAGATLATAHALLRIDGRAEQKSSQADGQSCRELGHGVPSRWKIMLRNAEGAETVQEFGCRK
jgi:hypothetical protein